MSKTGYAVRFYGSSQPIKFEQVYFPDVLAGQVGVKIKAAGVCASDLHFIRRTETPAKMPIIMGHEGAGIVEDVGEGIKNLKKDDRVIVNYVLSCGKCDYCLSGWENFCENVSWTGLTDEDGTFSEYMILPARNVLPLPSNVPFEQGALIGCAVVTPFHAMSIAEVKPGDTVSIIGIGGVGIHAIQMARVFGAAKVIAIDIADYKLKLAKEAGADATVNSLEEDAVQAVKKITLGKGPDLVFEFFGSESTIQQALQMSGPKGKIVLVGIYRGKVNLDVGKLLYDEGQIRTSMDHTTWDLKQTIDLVANGRIDLSKSVTHQLPLKDYSKAFEILKTKSGNPVRIALIP